MPVNAGVTAQRKPAFPRSQFSNLAYSGRDGVGGGEVGGKGKGGGEGK